MDVKDLQTTITPLTAAPFFFPEGDVNKHGKLKPVRRRVLKKLLKYEFKALATGMLILIISLIACSILLAVQIPLYEQDTPSNSDETPWFLILTVMLAVCLNFGTFIGSLILPSKRYRKNFFKDEGYLTFSIPASAHEQILAKHIASVLCYVAGWLANVISLTIILSALGIGDGGGGNVTPMDPSEVFEAIVIFVELLILALMFPVFLTTLDGAAAWWEQRLPEKHRRLIIALIVIGIIALFETLSIVMLVNGVTQAILELPPTLLLFLMICIGAAIICGFYAYEVKSFKKNINLK